jgi:hypothetical protein
MRRAIFASILLVLSAASGALAQSIALFSHTTVLANGQAMAECGTTMNDSGTLASYSAVDANCGFYLNSSRLDFFSCPATKPTSECHRTYSTTAGQSYSTHSTHDVYTYYYTTCNGAGGYFDPFYYCIPLNGGIVPSFGETGTRVASNLPTCWSTGPDCLIGYTTSNSRTTTSVSPSQVTLYQSKTQLFTANKTVTWSLLQGNGQLAGNLYTAPAQISDGESAVVQACDSQNLVDCAKATITLRNATVTVTPTGSEVLPIPAKTVTFKAAILPSTLSQTVTWSRTPEFGSINATTGVYTPPTNDELTGGPIQITVKACSTNPTTLCGTTTATVPKIGITVTGPAAMVATPGNTVTLGANAFGSVTSQDVTWTASAGTFTAQGFNTILYTPPAITATQTVTFHVCLTASTAICASPDATLVLVPPVTITSAGVWNAGATSTVTITGTGFGTDPSVSLSDPGIPLSLGARSSTSIVLTATVPVSSGGQPLTVTVTSSTGGVTPPPASVTVTPVKAVLTINPTSAQLREGQAQAFTSTCTAGGVPCTAPGSPSWTAVLGSFSPSVATTTSYTAPSSVSGATTIPVLACWSITPQQCATAQVTVNPLTVAVTPTSASVNGCSTKQFNAQVTNATVTTVDWSVVPQVGNIDANGFYTAPCPVTTQTQVQVRACSTANSQRCGASTVTLLPVQVTVSPQAASVQPGGTQQFSTVVLNASNLGVNWSLNPAVPAAGSIDANGLYRAPSAITTVTSVTVTATSKADNVTTGTAQVLLVASAAGLAPATLTFAAQDVGTTSAAQAITLSNPGTAAFSISSITTTGEFSQTNNCAASLAPGGSCTVNVQFTPTAMGTRTGTLRVTDSAPGSPHIASLNGTGRGAGASLNPTSLDFGGQRAGFATAAQTVTLANTGTGPMTISGVSVTGDFTQTNNCGASLPAGGSCAVSVRFSPAAGSLGQRPGTLQVNDSAPGSPHTASLTGTVLGGFHDNALCEGSSGWAWDSARPNTPINVYVFEGNNLLATVLANQYRGDLVGMGSNGYHGFSWPMLPSLRDGAAHTVTIRFSPDSSAVPIPGSPKSVTCAPTPSYQGYQDTTNCQVLSGWGWDSTQPNTPIDLYIFQGTQYLAAVRADQYRQDLASSGIGNGAHGFSWQVPSSLVDGQPHSLSVHFGSSSTSDTLIGSPATITCSAGQPATAGILWIQPAESSWGPAGTLTAAGYGTNGTGGVELVWRERSSAGVWGGWTTVGYQPPPGTNTYWSNTISSGSPTDICHWFEAYVHYSGVTSTVFQYTGASGCP